eukprot:768740-Hanusia_phi.AAC.1
MSCTPRGSYKQRSICWVGSQACSDESAFALYRKARWSCDMVDLMEDAKNKEEILRLRLLLVSSSPRLLVSSSPRLLVSSSPRLLVSSSPRLLVSSHLLAPVRVAEKTALLSVEKDPTIHETHKAVAITKGKLQNFVGMAEKVRLAKEVKEYIEKSLEIRPTDSASWHVLGEHARVRGEEMRGCLAGMWHAGVTKL